MYYPLSSNGFTELEKRAATSCSMNTDEAVQHLKQDAKLRTVRETLTALVGMDGSDKTALKKKIVELLKQGNPSLKKDSQDKNVRNWLADDVQAVSRDSAIQLVYALHLPTEQAEACMMRLCGESFHWRSPEDIVWVYGLKNGLAYWQAAELMHRLRSKGLLDLPKSETPDSMTAIIRQNVAQLSTEAELEEFLADARGQLGMMHNTAFRMFTEFMNVLQNPAVYSTEVIPAGEKMSVREVVATYLYNEYIPRARRRGKSKQEISDAVRSAIQRNIHENWPDESTLSRMKNREIDVTRKVLILLFLATDGGDSAYAEYDELDADEIYESMETRLNLMLADCGFSQLDSRTPFDWMVLYCMYADESIFIEDNMRKFLDGVFSSTSAEN